MIKYTLRCANDHRFDSWFASAEAYDTLRSSGRVTCAVCGSTDVEKSLMSPQVRPARAAAKVPGPPAERPLSNAPSEMEDKLSKLRKHIEDNSDYVGRSFANEARAIHDGEAPERAIYGEASGAEVRGLVEDGVPVAPLPFAPQRKVN